MIVLGTENNKPDLKIPLITVCNYNNKIPYFGSNDIAQQAGSMSNEWFDGKREAVYRSKQVNRCDVQIVGLTDFVDKDQVSVRNNIVSG